MVLFMRGCTLPRQRAAARVCCSSTIARYTMQDSAHGSASDVPCAAAGVDTTQVYDRDEGTWTDVPTNVNSVCGGWARLANGQVGLFAGHYATLDVYQVGAV